jgi:hypothetical protein
MVTACSGGRVTVGRAGRVTLGSGATMTDGIVGRVDKAGRIDDVSCSAGRWDVMAEGRVPGAAVGGD